jgi:hypothetical protein
MNAPDEWRQAQAAFAPASLRRCESLGDVTEIFDSDAQIAILPRRIDRDIVGWFNAAVLAGALGGGFRTTLFAGDRLALDLLPDLPGRELLATDIGTLNQIYCDLLGCPAAGVRLEVVAGAMCPRFHVDRVGVRMLCTYRGPGTEWLDDRDADRRLLGRRAEGASDESSGLMLDPKVVQVVPTFAIALLKGSLWQGNAGRGIIHRSPAVADMESPRVLLAIDAFWD